MPRITHPLKRLSNALAVVAGMILLSMTVSGQEGQYDKGTPPQHASGVSPLGSYTSADLGAINLSNGALNFKLPVATIGGRGLSLPLTLNYSSKVWSASRDSNFADETGNHPVAYAAYADIDNLIDIYSRVAPGWTLGAAPTLTVRGSGIQANPTTSCAGDFKYALTRLTVILPDKGELQFRDTATDGAPLTAQLEASLNCTVRDGNRGQRWHATDGSGAVFVSDSANGIVRGDLSGVLILSDGTRYRFAGLYAPPPGSPPLDLWDTVKFLARATSITDRNGNTITITYPASNEVRYTDQLGRITKIQKNVADPSYPYATLPLLVTIPGYQGQNLYFKVKTLVMNQRYRSGINPTLPVINGDYDPMGWGLSWGTATRLFSQSHGLDAQRIDINVVLSEFILPDGRSLQFFYNEFGEVAEVQMPTGGKVQYDYQYLSTLPAGKSLPGEVITSHFPSNVSAIERAVVARRTYPDGVNKDADWNYSYTLSTAQVTATSAAAAVLLNQKHYFLASGRNLYAGPGVGIPIPDRGVDGSGYNLWSTGIERRTETLNAAGSAVIAAGEQDWSQRTPIAWTGTTYPSYQTEKDNRVNEERKILDTGQTARSTTIYDLFNNPTESSEFDFDNTLKRRMVTSYSSTNLVNGVNYADDSIRLIRLPLQQSIYDGAGVEQARTIYEYDIYTGDGNHDYLLSYGSITGHDTANYGLTKTARGNATRIGNWIKTTSSYLYTYPRFDIPGNVVSSKDPNGNVASVSFADDFGDGSNPGGGLGGTFGTTYALPTLITSPPPTPGAPAHTARSQYDFSTGLPTGFRDRNNIVTQTIYNDPFNRPTLVKSALGVVGVENHATMYYAPATAFGITLTNNDVLAAKDQTSLDDGALRSWTHTDGFGRAIEAWSRDPQGDTKVITNYDGLGRAHQTSNPFRPSLGETAVYTTAVYDLAGRGISVTTPDSAVVGTSYSGNTVTVTDQAGKKRKSVTDGLGRLKEVYEDPTALNYLTSYNYDVLDNLTTVTQGAQTRTFGYDSLKRLTSAYNPESGTVTYGYDNNSNLISKFDARSITTSFAYDALNRATSKSYNDIPQTPQVDYYYDNAAMPSGAPSFDRGSATGRLVAVTYGSGSSAGTYRGYDILGQVVRQYQRTDSVNYLVEATYNLASSMVSETYPSVPGAGDRRTVTYTPDAAGRLASLSSSATSYAPAASVSSIGYTSHNALKTETYGNSLLHGVTYNNRLQPNEIKLGISGAPSSVVSVTYNYGTTANNGNVLSTSYAGGGLSYTQTFGYDQLNRLTTSQEGASWSQTNSYDPYGNRSIVGGALTFSATNNRITNAGYAYDAAGNLTNDTAHGYTFDAENKISKVDNVAAYVYDGEGQRVRKLVNENLRFIYGISGQQTAEFDGATGALKKEYVYGASGLVATIEPTSVNANGTRYTTSDHLGSPRLVTSSAAGVVSRHDYMPFGEELFNGGRTFGMGYGTTDGIRQKFTLKERDNETGLDYFLARYYSSTQGRFTSPDEFTGGPDELFDFAETASANPTFYADLGNPQSLNKYQYTYNNPLNMVDPDGHCPDCPGFIIVTPRTLVAIINNPLDSAQIALSVVGLIPGAGEVADVANAGISVRRGNYGEAAIDLGGAFGPVGSGVAIVNRIRKIAKVASKADDATDALRTGKNFTKKGKQEVIEQNKTQNNGTTKCNECGTQTVPGQQSKKGVPKPANETQVDHKTPKSRGGEGRPPNGQVLCRLCNQKKGNTLPE